LLGWFGLFLGPIAPVWSKDTRADAFGERQELLDFFGRKFPIFDTG
jgi:hypothetical protein